jgi:hypothetical protein
LKVARKRKFARTGIVTRYFLRRLAQAQREDSPARSLHRNARAYALAHARARARAYTRALAEVITLFVLMPGIAVFSLAAWVCVRAPGPFASAASGQSQLAPALLVTFALVLAGHLGFTRALRRFRQDASAAQDYDTDEDRQIAFWQKFAVTALCGVAAPLCALFTVMTP